MDDAINELKNGMGAIVAFTENPNAGTLGAADSKLGQGITDWDRAATVLWTMAGQASEIPTLAGSGPATTSPSRATTSAPAPPTSPPTATTSPSATSARRVAVFKCPTTFGITPQQQSVPTSLNVLGAPRSTSGLVAYTNTEAFLVAPAGMACSGTVAADGGQQIIVWPKGSSTPSQHSQTDGLTLSLDPACASCKASDACPFLVSVAKSLGFPCTTDVPAAESVDRLSAQLIAFEDPPGLAGDGWPSSGPDPANGVLGVSGSANQAWRGSVFRSTCTLPASEHALCTTVLNDVIARYG
jgi:hypothetical protein